MGNRASDHDSDRLLVQRARASYAVNAHDIALNVRNIRKITG